jgi:hypothetical protein
MATVDKAFRIKNGLVVEGATATVNTHDVITKEIFDAKGDLIVGTGSNAGSRLAAGTNGYVLTADSAETSGLKWAAAPAVGSFETSIVFEGATANDFETTLTVTDPTADRIITFPDATTTVVGTDTTQTLTNKTIDSPTITSTNGAAVIHGILLPAAHGISFEGTTENDFETILTVVDPTEDRTVTFPNATGTVVLEATSSTLTNKTIALGSNTVSGTIAEFNTALTDQDFATLAGTETLTNKTLTSPAVSGLSITDGSFVVEGATANEFETTVQFTDPTQDRTITIPNVTGTVITTGDTGSVTNTMLAGSIANEKLSNSAITINGTSTSLGGSRTLGSDDIAEGSTNKYFTDERAQDAIGDNVGNGLDYNDTTGAISVDPSEFALSAVGAPTGDVSLATYKITGLGTPTNATDAATKAYVDSAAQGIDWKASVRAATDGNRELLEMENGEVVDGVTLATGDRVLVKNQTDATANGIYVVQASGAPVRSSDADSGTEVTANFAVFVEEGTVNADSGWTLTNNGTVTVGTTALVFTQFTGLGQITAGTGLDKTGNTLNIDSTVTTNDGTQTLTNKSISGSANTLTNIPNNALSNSAITINGTSTSLGGTRTLGTDDVSEGSTNKYFTDERAQDAVGTTLGTGLSYNDTTGAISNSGVLSITGTSNQVTADVSTGAVTLSLPQSIHTAASPTFAGLSVGSGSVTAGSLTLTDALIGTATQAITDGTATVVDTWAVATYSSAKYIVQMKNGNDIEVLEVLVTVDGNNNVYLTEYADIISNASIGTTDADYVGGNVRLKVTSSNGTSVKVHKTLIEA